MRITRDALCTRFQNRNSPAATPVCRLPIRRVREPHVGGPGAGAGRRHVAARQDGLRAARRRARHAARARARRNAVPLPAHASQVPRPPRLHLDDAALPRPAEPAAAQGLRLRLGRQRRVQDVHVSARGWRRHPDAPPPSPPPGSSPCRNAAVSERVPVFRDQSIAMTPAGVLVLVRATVPVYVLTFCKLSVMDGGFLKV